MSNPENQQIANSTTVSATTILIQQHPPRAVYWDEVFDVSFIIHAAKTSSSRSIVNKSRNSRMNQAVAATSENLFDISVSLHDGGERNSGLSRLVRLETSHIPTPLPIGVTGTLRCALIRENNENQLWKWSFRIRIAAAPSSSYGEDDRIETDWTQTAAAVFTRDFAIVRYKILVRPSIDWTSIWYKDEGGRDKCMEVVASVYDHRRTLLYDALPLLLTLCYAGKDDSLPEIVHNQEILRIASPKMNELRLDKKTGNIRIRFRIEDVSKNHQGQDFCLQVSPAANSESITGRIAPGVSPPITVRSKRNKRRMVSSNTAMSFQLAHTPHVKQRTSFVTDQSAAVHPQRYHEAVNGIIRWAKDVVESLPPLEWQVSGFAHDVEGNLDYNRPFHNMINPNEIISRLLMTYNESTRQQLQLLQHAFDQHNALSLVSEETFPTSFVSNTMRSYHPTVASDGYRAIPSDDFPRFTAPVQGRHQNRVVADKHKSDGGVVHSTYGNFSAASTELDHNSSNASDPVSVNEVVASRHLHGGLDSAPEVEYVLARQFKSVRTDERLGFPAFSSAKHLLGFFQEPSMKNCHGKFIPLAEFSDHFGEAEKRQATFILEQAMEESNGAVHSIEQWGSMSNMLNHVLVYEWKSNLTTEQVNKENV